MALTSWDLILVQRVLVWLKVPMVLVGHLRFFAVPTRNRLRGWVDTLSNQIVLAIETPISVVHYRTRSYAAMRHLARNLASATTLAGRAVAGIEACFLHHDRSRL